MGENENLLLGYIIAMLRLQMFGYRKVNDDLKVWTSRELCLEQWESAHDVF
jgi:hypothetical protein